MNRSRSDRSLGSMDERTHKRLKTVDETELESEKQVGKVIEALHVTEAILKGRGKERDSVLSSNMADGK